MPKYCLYILTNNSKTHKSGDTCGTVIRKKEETYCWKHKNYINKVPLNINNSEYKNEKKSEFIQLENSNEKK
jgi:hypothetical protein